MMAGVAVGSAWSGPALGHSMPWSTAGGVYVSYHFGGGTPARFAFGLEVRRLHAQTSWECGDGASNSFGGVARLQGSWDQLRLVVAPQVGRRNAFVEGSGEVGLGYQLGRQQGPVLQRAVEGSFLRIGVARLAYSVTRDFSVALGARITPGESAGCYVVGRPLRRGDGRAALPTVMLVDGSDGTPGERDAEVCCPAVGAWAERAACEWSSVPAFEELARQLELCGAPEELPRRARLAAEDELRHAVLSAGVAGLLGGGAIGLEPPALDRRPAVAGRAGLRRLAVESWIDGCLGEGAAAATAAHEADLAVAPELRQMQRSIAADESRHAELAWDVLRWTLSVGGDEVRELITQAEQSATLPGPRSAGSGVPALTGLGCAPPELQQEIALRHRMAARARWSELSGGSRA